jgi:hypothetical protein
MVVSSTIFEKLHRLTASLLLLVMLVPALAPFAAAGIAPAGGMHCKRMPLSDRGPNAAPPARDPAMHCHHAASQNAAVNSKSSASAATPVDFFRASDCCCNQDCDCCRSLKTSTWARPTFSHLAVLGMAIEATAPSANFSRSSAIFGAPDSARAPPRS